MAQIKDNFLEKRIVVYDEWFEDGKISFSSRIIPISESFNAKQWVLPSEQAEEIVRNAQFIAVQNCECRSHYKRCDHPLEVCLLFDEVGRKLVSRNEARRISFDESKEVLKKADNSGLIHLALYMPDHKIYALCSCCTCCCHELQIVKEYGRTDLLVQSDYLAITDFDICIHCGDCVERCPFEARIFQEDEMKYNSDMCLGCGLCVSVCPVEATSMVLRNSDSV